VFVHEAGELVVAFLALRAQRLLQDVRGALEVGLAAVRPGADGVVQRVDDVGVVHVELAAVLELDEARRAEPGARAAVAVGVAPEDVGAEVGEPDAPDRGERAVEAQLDDLATEPVRLEDLRRPVGVDGRDAHLRHDLQHAVLNRVLVVLERFGRLESLDHPLGCAFGEVREREVRADQVGAVAEQACEVRRLTRLAGVADDRSAGPCPGPDEPVMDGADGGERGDGSALGAGRPV
jgi:hypothetical protein